MINRECLDAGSYDSWLFAYENSKSGLRPSYVFQSPCVLLFLSPSPVDRRVLGVPHLELNSQMCLYLICITTTVYGEKKLKLLPCAILLT